MDGITTNPDASKRQLAHGTQLDPRNTARP
jgi:hypothetical protein